MMDKPQTEIALLELAQDVAWPEPSQDLAEGAMERLGAVSPTHRTVSRRLVGALTVIFILVGTLVFSPTARQAVADLLNAAGIQIRFVGEPAQPTSAGLDLGEELTLATAATVVDFVLLHPAGDEPGRPDGVHLAPEHQINMVWHGGGTLPAALETDVALLFSQIAVGDSSPLAFKAIGPGTDTETVLVRGGLGLWIEGADHSITLLDAAGQPIPFTTRLAANVLLWENDDVNYRLETKGDIASALQIAESLEPVK